MLKDYTSVKMKHSLQLAHVHPPGDTWVKTKQRLNDIAGPSGHVVWSVRFHHLDTEIVGSNPDYGMEVFLRLSVSFCPGYVEALRRADPPSKEFYQLSKLSVVRSQGLSACVMPWQNWIYESRQMNWPWHVARMIKIRIVQWRNHKNTAMNTTVTLRAKYILTTWPNIIFSRINNYTRIC
jgi:hypothetical protein